MLDRKTIKKDVKGILGGESRGPVFLATLISFIIVLVYFGAVWVIAQFYPIGMSELEAISTWSQSQVLIAPQTESGEKLARRTADKLRAAEFMAMSELPEGELVQLLELTRKYTDALAASIKSMIADIKIEAADAANGENTK